MWPQPPPPQSFGLIKRKNFRCKKCGERDIVWSDDPEGTRVCTRCGAAMVVRFQLESATFGRRLTAAIADWCVLVVGIGLLQLFYLSFLPPTLIPDWRSVWLPWLVGPPIYWLVMTATGETLGKRGCSVTVVNRQGGPPGLKRAALRELLKLLLLFTLGMGLLWIIWDKQKQGWHDKIAGTYVIYTRVEVQQVAADND